MRFPGATLSFHLKELVNAGLIESESRGRNVCYRANFDAMNGLIAYLTHQLLRRISRGLPAAGGTDAAIADQKTP